jgi:hypothetical protein
MIPVGVHCRTDSGRLLQEAPTSELRVRSYASAIACGITAISDVFCTWLSVWYSALMVSRHDEEIIRHVVNGMWRGAFQEREVCRQGGAEPFAHLIPQAYAPTVQRHTTMRSSAKDSVYIGGIYH